MLATHTLDAAHPLSVGTRWAQGIPCHACCCWHQQVGSRVTCGITCKLHVSEEENLFGSSDVKSVGCVAPRVWIDHLERSCFPLGHPLVVFEVHVAAQLASFGT